MTLVAQTTSPTTGAQRDRTIELQEWALSRQSIDEHLHAIELVLTHDFDEPSAPGPRRETAQRSRERFLIAALGIAERDVERRPVTFIGRAETEDRDHRIAA